MIPGKDKKWVGQFPGNYSGNLHQTFNIDLERNPGRIALSDKLLRFASGLGVVTKFIRTNATTTDQWFGLVANDIIRNGSSALNAGTWITDDISGTFNDPLDAVVHELANGEQRLLVTRAAEIAILNKAGGANVWDDDWGSTVAGLTLTSSAHHPIARLQRLVAVGDKVSGVPVIHTIDKDDVVQNSRLSFGAEYTVKSIYTTSNRFWFGLQNDLGNKAKIIEWDGFSLTYNNEYEIIGTVPMVGFVVDDIPYFITEFGYVYRFNGGAFEKVQDFGLKESGLVFSTTDIGNYNAYVDGKLAYINVRVPLVSSISATSMSNGARRLRSGVWIFNTENLNLYHNMAAGEHASAGTDVNYGSHMAAAGAIYKLASSDTLIASASVYIGGATWQASTQSGLYEQVRNDSQASNTGRNRGYFITPYIPTQDIEAMWDGLWLKFKKFVNSNNRIVVKWRSTEPLFNSSAQDQAGNALKIMNGTGTWVNTTSFTSKVPVGVAVGDEVEILSGDNGGCSFKISALSATPDNSTAITVTISEAAPTSSTDTFLCRFDNWTSETEISSTTIGTARIPFSAPAHGPFLQLKIELRGFDVHIDELLPTFTTKTSSKQA